MLNDGARMKTIEVDTWLDAGTSEAILETNAHLLNRLSNTSESSPHLEMMWRSFLQSVFTRVPKTNPL